jgi:hypothetical protein
MLTSRLVGALLYAAALVMIVFHRSVVAFLGRPIGWGGVWESFRGAGGFGDVVYGLYKAYTVIAGWFYFVALLSILIWMGTQHLLPHP